jgi:ribosomal 30S subunit maturation factor RimM
MKACTNCKFIVKDSDKCPLCSSTDLTEKFFGILVIIDVKYKKPWSLCYNIKVKQWEEEKNLWLCVINAIEEFLEIKQLKLQKV